MLDFTALSLKMHGHLHQTVYDLHHKQPMRNASVRSGWRRKKKKHNERNEKEVHKPKRKQRRGNKMKNGIIAEKADGVGEKVITYGRTWRENFKIIIIMLYFCWFCCLEKTIQI